jgi:hypothetical protein
MNNDQNPTVSRAEFDAVLNQVAKDVVQVKPEPRTWASNVEFKEAGNNVQRRQKIIVVNDPNSPLPEPQRVESAEPRLSDFYSKSQDALEAIQTATQAFAQEYGQPNKALIAAKEDVARLERELHEAKARLEAEIAKGDGVSRFATAVLRAESAFAGFQNFARLIVGNSILEKLLGHVPSKSKRDATLEAIVKNHVRIARVNAVGSAFVRDLPNNPSKELLESRAAAAAKQLEKLIAHVQKDEAENGK